MILNDGSETVMYKNSLSVPTFSTVTHESSLGLWAYKAISTEKLAFNKYMYLSYKK